MFITKDVKSFVIKRGRPSLIIPLNVNNCKNYAREKDKDDIEL